MTNIIKKHSTIKQKLFVFRLLNKISMEILERKLLWLDHKLKTMTRTFS